jgi:hypothetical protein
MQLHSRRIGKMSIAALVEAARSKGIALPDIATIDIGLHPPAVTLACSQSILNPRAFLSHPWTHHVARRLVSDEIAEEIPASQVLGLGLLDLAPEPAKTRLRILTDTLSINIDTATTAELRRFRPIPPRTITDLISLLTTDPRVDTHFNYGASIDLEKSFFQVSLHETLSRLMCFVTLDATGRMRFYRMLRMAMGFVRAADVMQALIRILIALAISEMNPCTPSGALLTDPYVDNICWFTTNLATCEEFGAILERLALRFAITIGERQRPSSVITHRGVVFDLEQRTFCLKQSFVSKLSMAADFAKHYPTRVRREHLDSLAGMICYVYAVHKDVPVKRCHALISALVSARQSVDGRWIRNEHCTDSLVLADLGEGVRLSTTIASLTPRNSVLLTISDASDYGWAVAACLYTNQLLIRTFNAHGIWTPSQHAWHINCKELYAAGRGRLAFPEATHRWIPITDSLVTAGALLRRYSPSPQLFAQLIAIHLPLTTIQTTPWWIPTTENPTDAPSRGETLSGWRSDAQNLLTYIAMQVGACHVRRWGKTCR